MKILTPNEFKFQNPNAYLDDYLTYLEQMQEEAEEALNNATTLTKNDSIIEDIRRQAEDILKMATLVEEYMGHIILKTLDTLSLEELQSYFDFEEENRLSDAKKAELESDKKELQDKLEDIERQINNNLYLNGRVKEFYEADDTKEFFAPSEDPYKFLEDLLSALSVDKLFEAGANELSRKILLSLETECIIQNIDLSKEDLSDLCAKIMELFRKIKNIIKYSPDAKSHLAKVVLSESGIKQFLPECFVENTALYLIQDLMNLKKLDTNFYNGLPADLREKLESTRLQNEPYDTLLQTYQAYLNNEDLPSEDLSQEEKAKKKELEDNLEKVNSDLKKLSDEREAQEEFLVNEEKLRTALREKIQKMMGDQVSAADIDAVIKDEETKLATLKAKLSEASALISTKTNALEKAKSILLGSEYHSFFQAVELNNVRRLYKFFGVDVTEEVVLPFLNEEKRRLDQITIMIDLQDKLDSIYESISKQKAKGNFITRRLTSYKETLQSLDEQYQKEIRTTFERLKEKELFYVNAPKIAATSTVGNVIILPPEETQIEPADFNEVNGLTQTLWNMSSGIDDNTKRKFLATSPEYTSWEDYYQDLTQKHAELIKKLFCFAKGEDGYYTFASTTEERENLKLLQTIITEILSSIYEERKAFTERLGTSDMPLDPDMVLELEQYLGKGSNPSRENLSVYIEQTATQIAELRQLIADNYTLCTNLGITIPQDIEPNITTAQDDNTIEERIQALNIEGVSNLDEAISYRDLLLGLEQFTVPAARVRKYYSDHRSI